MRWAWLTRRSSGTRARIGTPPGKKEKKREKKKGGREERERAEGTEGCDPVLGAAQLGRISYVARGKNGIRERFAGGFLHIWPVSSAVIRFGDGVRATTKTRGGLARWRAGAERGERGGERGR